MSAEKNLLGKEPFHRIARTYQVLEVIKDGGNRFDIKNRLIQYGFSCQGMTIVDRDVSLLKQLGFEIKSSNNARIGYIIANPEKDYFQTIEELVLCQQKVI